MGNFQAVYYRNLSGREPVREFINNLDPKRRAVLFRQIELLNELSESTPHLPYPHSSQIEGELRELRCHHGSLLYRVLYRRTKRLIILLHAFRKNSKKVPESDIQIARKRWTDFKSRMDAIDRKQPRAAGRDAP